VFIGVSLLAVREQLGNGWMIGYCSVVWNIIPLGVF
jgi:hypothetical protein